MTITYHFPTIPAGQTLNSRMHWGQRAKLAEEAKEYATALILEQRNGRQPAMMERAEMAIAFTCPNGRVIDLMALGERVKPYIDALCPQYAMVNGKRVMVAKGDIIDDRRQVIPHIILSAEYIKGESGVTIPLTPL